MSGRVGRARAEAGPGTQSGGAKKSSGPTDCQGHEADKSENIEIRNKEIYEFWHDINTCIARERETGRDPERYTSFGYALATHKCQKQQMTVLGGSLQSELHTHMSPDTLV